MHPILSSISPTSHFSTANLPYGIVSTPHTPPFVATRLGDVILNLSMLCGFFADRFPAQVVRAVVGRHSLNALMGVDKQIRVQFRIALQEILLKEDSPLFHDGKLVQQMTCRMDEVKCHLPCRIGDYTDFYASKQHATNVGIMYRGKDNALQPNYLKLPVGYHGRSSSVIPSGTPVVRPCGQLDEGKTYGPCRKLDYEVEIGVVIGGGPGNKQFHPVSVSEARSMVFGYVLLNDWSARDVQVWEYVPLGPFTAKNFATTISTWIIPAEALEPLRQPMFEAQNPPPLPYLIDDDPTPSFNIDLQVLVSGTLVGKTNFKFLYWSVAQMIAHHTCTGCNLRPGDLLGTGTISGTTPDSYGSLLESTWNGTKPIQLRNGSTRTFLQDGDEVVMTGAGVLSDGRLIGFGECTGRVLPPALQGAHKL